MKKYLLFILVITICVSMCACSEPITKEELLGSWNFEDESATISIYFDDEDRVGYVFIELEPGSKPDGYNVSDYESCGGSFEIENDTVIISFDESTRFGRSCVVEYKNGKLQMGEYSLAKK